MGASVISCCDTSPVLDPAEHVFDAMALPVEDFVVVGRVLSLFPWWNARRNPLVFQFLAKPVGIIAAIGEQLLGFRQFAEQLPCALVVAHLAFGEQKHQGSP